LAASSFSATLEETLSTICRSVKHKGRCFRAINPWGAEDFRMLQFLARGEMHVNGFRNRNLRAYLEPHLDKDDSPARSRASGRTSRRLALLRAHGLIKKIPKENRYLLTAKGRKVTAALLADADFGCGCAAL